MGETNDRAREDAAQGFRIRRLAAERAKLTNPIDRIVFDNQWVDGLPVGLWLMAHEARGLALDDDARKAAAKQRALSSRGAK